MGRCGTGKPAVRAAATRCDGQRRARALDSAAVKALRWTRATGLRAGGTPAGAAGNARPAGDAAGAAAQRDAVSKALGDVSYSKTGTAPPSVSAAPSYNPTYQPSPGRRPQRAPRTCRAICRRRRGPRACRRRRPARTVAAAVLRADDAKAVGPTDAGALAQADGLAGTDADVRADLRARLHRHRARRRRTSRRR